jgi:proteasome-associated ATPase
VKGQLLEAIRMNQNVKPESTRPSPRRPSALPPGTLEDRLTLIDRLGSSSSDVRFLAQELARESDGLHQTLDELREIQSQLKDKLNALCAPEHYPAIITAVRNPAERMVEVFGANVFLEVAVHPDVPAERLCVGARGVLSQGRNCLLEVDGVSPRWQDVAVFEGYHSERRLLLRHQEQLVVATASDELARNKLAKGELIGFDRSGAGLAYARVEPPGHEDLFFEDTPIDRFDELGGLDSQIARLRDAVLFNLQHPEKARRYRLPNRRGILLDGPPGNGKTKLARCLARFIAECMPAGKCRFMHVAGSSDYSMWLGQSEQHIIARFTAARKLALKDGLPVVMFFDEIDAIGRRRGTDLGSGAPDRILSTLLAQLDGVVQIPHLLVIAATNRADVLDSALTRPGRLGNLIHIPPPSRRAARAILERYLGDGLPVAGKLDSIIEALASYLYSPAGRYAALARVTLRDGRKLLLSGRDFVSGAMLEDVVHTACTAAAKRDVETGAEGVTEDDMLAALDQAMRAAVVLLTAANVRSYIPRLPPEVEPVAVEVQQRGAAGAAISLAAR